MSKKLFSIFFLGFSLFIFAQQKYLIGNITNEFGDKLPSTTVYNVRTGEIVSADKEGNYIISALPTDQIRFVREGYERADKKLTEDNFSKPLHISLTKTVIEIEEVKIAFKPTGDLKKDLKQIGVSPKILKLNTVINAYAHTKPTEVLPQNATPSAFRQRDYNAGQVNLLKLGGAIIGLIDKAVSPKITEPTYSERQAFFTKVKQTVDMAYFEQYGMDEYQFDIFLAYVDKIENLAKNYRNDFNKSTIENTLKKALKEYLKTHPLS